MSYFELNLDGLVGPTHHYAGLSEGNMASTSNALIKANPAAAALQGLKKMRLLHHLGIKQAVVPPHQRPNLELLHRLGFTGSPALQISHAKKVAPELLSASFSAASMWTANMATVSSDLDTGNNRTHFTPANLIHNIHRSQEADFSYTLLQRLFQNTEHFEHHPPLIKTNTLSDEGAANHSRLCPQHGHAGINLFVYGKRTIPTNNNAPLPSRYPARQTLEAQLTLARLHQLDPAQTLFAQQSPRAIDAGVFHNDVISVANESVFLVHEDAFFEQQRVLTELKAMASFPISIIEISRQQLSLKETVNRYLFNSQLITKPNGTMALIAPHECEEHPYIEAFVRDLMLDNSNPINEVHYLNLKQSMQNGGGPACLRLRVPLHTNALLSMHPGVLVNDSLLDTLEIWVNKHYRTSLHANDLDDPMLITECLDALDELTQLLQLGDIYPFQCGVM